MKNKYYLYILLISIFILGLYLRIDKLGQRSFWFDEVVELNQVHGIEQDKSLIGEEVRGRVVTRGYYLILYLLKDFGYSEFAARLPSAIFGIFSIILIYILGKSLFGDKTGIISAFLLAISTFHIYYSQEARPYSMFMCFSILTYYCLYNALKKKNITWGIGFIVFTLLNIYTHFAGFYVLGSQIIFASLWIIIGFKNYKDEYFKYGLTFFIFIIMALFILKPVLKIGLKCIIDNAFIKHDVRELLFNLNFFHKMFGYFSSFSMNFRQGDWLFYIYVCFALWPLFFSIKRFTKEILGLILWFIVPFVMLFTVFKPFGFFNVRYFIFILPLFLIAVSCGINSFSNIISMLFKKLNVNYIMCSIVIIIAVLNLKPLQMYHYMEKDDSKGIAEYLSNNATPGDKILFARRDDYRGIWFYLSDRARKDIHIERNIENIRNVDGYIWHIKYFEYKIKDLYDNLRVLDLKNYYERIILLKLKDKDKITKEDLQSIKFKIESEYEPGIIGHWDIDNQASGLKARVANKGQEGWLLIGPHIVLPEGKYKARFRVKVCNNKEKDKIAILNIYNGGDALKTPYINLKGADFQKNMQYQDFSLEFDQSKGDRQEFRVCSFGKTDIWVDYVEVKRID